MADALTRFGLSRRPASEMFGEAPRPRRDSPTDLFGAADMRGPGWSDSARRAVEEHQAALDEELAIEDERASLEDQRIAREREREAEAVADEFTRIKEPSAREKFFDENEATMVGSKRYNALAEMRQRQPSFADNVLAKNLANKIDDPDERNVFLGAVAKGAGSNTTTSAGLSGAAEAARLRPTDSHCGKARIAAANRASAPSRGAVGPGDGGNAGTATAIMRKSRNGGAGSPAMRKMRAWAQPKEMTTPVATSTISTGADQSPSTLCQLKSRDLPR